MLSKTLPAYTWTFAIVAALRILFPYPGGSKCGMCPCVGYNSVISLSVIITQRLRLKIPIYHTPYALKLVASTYRIFQHDTTAKLLKLLKFKKLGSSIVLKF